MANIKVHVLNFHSIHSHIELVLENTSVNPHQYYKINRWDEYAMRSWSRDNTIKSLINFAGSIYAFDIEADPEQIKEKWVDYFQKTEGNILGENCAVAVQRFLTQFANIPMPNSSNISWNHLAFGIMWPSFIPCPVMLPGRVMDNAKFYTKNIIFKCNSVASLPDEHQNQYIKEAINHLKSIDKNNSAKSLNKLKVLIDFYDQLNNMDIQADLLSNKGSLKEADSAKRLIKNLQNDALIYLTDDSEKAFDNLKSNCKKHLDEAEPILEKHRDWKRILINVALAIVGAGVFYLVAVGINKAMKGGSSFGVTKSKRNIKSIKEVLGLFELNLKNSLSRNR